MVRPTKKEFSDGGCQCAVWRGSTRTNAVSKAPRTTYKPAKTQFRMPRTVLDPTQLYLTRACETNTSSARMRYRNFRGNAIAKVFCFCLRSTCGYFHDRIRNGPRNLKALFVSATQAVRTSHLLRADALVVSLAQAGQRAAIRLLQRRHGQETIAQLRTLHCFLLLFSTCARRTENISTTFWQHAASLKPEGPRGCNKGWPNSTIGSRRGARGFYGGALARNRTQKRFRETPHDQGWVGSKTSSSPVFECEGERARTRNLHTRIKRQRDSRVQ